MTRVYDLSDRYIKDYAALDPIFATSVGVAGYDDRLTDYSPHAVEERASFHRNVRANMEQADEEDERDRVAREFFLERMDRNVEFSDAGEEFRHLGVIWSPTQDIRGAFDLLPRDTTDQWRILARRMSAVPAAISGFIESLQLGLQQGTGAARRQALACARQARAYAGTSTGHESYFTKLVDEYVGRPSWDRKVEDALRKAAVAANGAYDSLAEYLTNDYAPNTTEVDGVGPERYALASRSWLGAALDPEESYEWGWQELARIRAEISEVVEQLSPGMTYREVVEDLNANHERVIRGENSLREWLESLMARTIEQLNGTHFDIPSELQRLEVRIAPPGGAAAQYYIGPSDDLSRPGTYWYPTNGQTVFPIWNEISTAYHEGVPGHHLQIGYVKYLRDELSAYQRHSMVSGHAEGWAMYAERLMGELGYFDRPEYRLNMLSNSLMRAARVVVDIGLHLSYEIPQHEAFHPGETWNADLALEFMLQNSSEDKRFMASEIERYLGLPGQATSYKLGERLWLEARESAKGRYGEAFDSKDFHMKALGLGPLGLDLLQKELATI